MPEEGNLVNSNERRATLNDHIWGSALRNGLLLDPAALFLSEMQQTHGAQNTIASPKKQSRRCVQLLC